MTPAKKQSAEESHPSRKDKNAVRVGHPHAPQIVAIEKPIYGGAFLARLEGKAVFVPLTLPGEQVLVWITQSKPGYATAEAEQIVRAAPERIAPACPHFGVCGGCHYQHIHYVNQLTIKQAILRETLERGGVVAPAEISVLSGEPKSQSWGAGRTRWFVYANAPSPLRCWWKPRLSLLRLRACLRLHSGPRSYPSSAMQMKVRCWPQFLPQTHPLSASTKWWRRSMNGFPRWPARSW